VYIKSNLKLSIRNLIYCGSIIFLSHVAILCSPSNAQAFSNVKISTGSIIEFFHGFNIPLPSARQRFIGDINKSIKEVKKTFARLMKGDSDILVMVFSAIIPFVLILMLIKKFQSNLKKDSSSRSDQMRSMLSEAKKESEKMDS